MATENSFTIGTKTAAMLTGKTIRTIINWVESGAIKGEVVSASNLPHGQIWEIDISGLAEHIPTELTEELLTCIQKAENGDAAATVCVAILLYKPESYAIALDWFALAAKRGDADAMYWLSEMYLKGHGVKANFATALRWMATAAEHGSQSAQARVDFIHNKINAPLSEEEKKHYQENLGVIRQYAAKFQVK